MAEEHSQDDTNRPFFPSYGTFQPSLLNESLNPLSTQRALKGYLKGRDAGKRKVILGRSSKLISEAGSGRPAGFAQSSTHIDTSKVTAAFEEN